MKESPSLAIVAPNGSFRDFLVENLSYMGSVYVSSGAQSPLPSSVQIVFLDMRLGEIKSSVPPHAKEIHIIWVKNEKELFHRENCIFVNFDTDPFEVATLLAKSIRGFSFGECSYFTANTPKLMPKYIRVYLVRKFHRPPKKTNVPSQPLVVLPKTPKTSSSKSAVVVKHTYRKTDINFRILKRKHVALVTLLVFWLLALPYLMLGASAITGLMAAKGVSTGRTTSGAALSSVSGVLSLASLNTYSAYQSAFFMPPYFRRFFNTSFWFSYLLYEGSLITKDIVNTINQAKSLPLSPSALAYAQKVALKVSTISAQPELLAPTLKLFPALKPLFENTDLVMLFAKSLARADVLLGYKEKATYMIMFQNNMEIRPTGGFIGSFAVLELERGEATFFKIYDVYDSDGQLKGFVEPPKAIAKYLGEAKWYLRDSNWDPDFSVSSRRALWFLEKSLDVKPIAVVSLNLEVLRSVLHTFGPLNIAETGETLNTQNFYEKIQSEVENNFFPGSRKKVNYLSLLSSNLLMKLEALKKEELLKLISLVSQQIKERNLQVYFEDEFLQSIASEAGADGTVEKGSLGFVEANLGVNKANKHVVRKGELVFSDKGNVLEVKSVLRIRNDAQVDSDQTKYKAYIRAFGPGESHLKSMVVEDQGFRLPVFPDTEIVKTINYSGTYIVVSKDQEKSIEVVWEIPKKSLPPHTNSNFSLKFRKQSGVPPYDISILDLTREGESAYNTQVSEDLFFDF